MLLTVKRLSSQSQKMKNSENYRLEEDTLKKDEMQKRPVKLKTKVKKLGKDFGQRTTAHGWARVSDAKAKTVKVIWLTVTLTAAIACGLHVSLLFAQYFRFSSEIKWQVAVSEIIFPSVSICNILPMSDTTARKLLADPNSQFSQWYNITENLDVFEEAAETLNRTDEFEIVQNRMKQPIGYFENIGNESQIVGHQKMDFILGCTYGHYNCDLGSFVHFENANYFNCYTFNSKHGNDALKAKSSGPLEGLSMILYLENDNGDNLADTTYHTLSNIGNAAGVRLIVHNPGSRASPVDHGLDIPPGFSANIALSLQRFQRLDHPYGNCIQDGEQDGANYIYTSHACLLLCQQEHIIEKCNCISSTLPISMNHAVLGLSYCAKWDVDKPLDLPLYFDQIFCEREAVVNFTTNETMKMECECFPECTDDNYQMSLSYSSWPLEYTQMNFFEKYVLNHENAPQLKAYKNLGRFNTTDLIQRGLIKSNFLRVNVYLQSMTIEQYVEKKSYELPNLFSDIGGTCGLWVGMSIITWCEFIELIVLFFYKVCKHFTKE